MFCPCTRHTAVIGLSPWPSHFKFNADPCLAVWLEALLIISGGATNTQNKTSYKWKLGSVLVHALIILKVNKKKISSEYLFYVLKSYYGESKLYSIRTGALHPHLNSTIVCDINVPVPTLEIQHTITSKIKKANETITLAISKAKIEIESIKEYRESLITDLVTGKSSVPQLQMS